MTKRVDVCGATFYKAQFGGSTFEEARAIAIGMYSQNELDSASELQIRDHLERCASCRQILEELKQLDEFLSDRLPLPVAFCPSSEKLDQYQFEASSLEHDDRIRISKHLQECPLCKEELRWLQELQPEAKAFLVPSKNWMIYLPVAAAIAFLVLSLAVVWQYSRSMVPDRELRALAVIKEPEQIDFTAIEKTAPVLPDADRDNYKQAVRLFKERHFQDASVLLKNILQRNPEHSASRMLLGYSYFKLGKTEEAFDLCDQAEKIQPRSPERCMLLVNVALKTGHFDRAITEITSLYHAAPDNPEINRLYHKIQELTQGRLLRL